jgi:hypothetical protein
VLPDARTWALERFGPNRPVSSEELVSALRQAVASGSPAERVDGLARVRAQALQSLDATSCRVTGIEDVRRLVDAQRALIETTAEAAMQGVVVDAVRAYARTLPVRMRSRAVDGWIAWRLHGGPEPADEAMHLLAVAADDLLLRWSFHRYEARAVTAPSDAFALPLAPSLCRGNPFASLPVGQPADEPTAGVRALLARPARDVPDHNRARGKGGTYAARGARPDSPLGTDVPGGGPVRR